MRRRCFRKSLNITATLFQLLLQAIIALLFCGVATAQNAGSTLQKIRDTGVLRVSYGASAPFFLPD